MDLPTTHYDEFTATTVVKEAEVKTTAVTNKKTLLARISSYILLASVFFAPLVFIPSVYAPLNVVKTIFLSACILIASLLYAIDALKSKTFVLPRFALGYISIGLILSILVSSFVSTSFGKSFFGQGFEIGTASFLFLMFLASFVVSRMIIKDQEIILKIYSALFLSFIVLALFHIARFIGGAGFMSFGILSTVSASLIGKWYDFGILTAIISLLSFLGIIFFPLRKGLKRILLISLIVSLALLFIVNSPLIWGALALVVLFVGVYQYSMNIPKGTGIKSIMSRISVLSLIVFLIAVACVWKGDTLAIPLIKSLKAEYGELILPWQLTLDVTAGTLKESPLLGAGANRFGFQYLRFKPLIVNQTPFWNSDFTESFGFIPTFLVTEGLVGALLWCLFLIFFVREGVRALRKVSDPLKRFLISTSFFTGAFLWLVDIIYSPSHVIIFLTFLFTGIFIALLISEGFVMEKHVDSLRGKFTKIVPIIYSVSIIILIIWIGAYTKRAVAITYFQKGIKELNANNAPDAAQSKFNKALSWNVTDVYYQALSEVNILKINTIAQELQTQSTQTPGAPADQKRIDQVLALTADSVKYTKNAEKLDPTNYYNYLAEARISDIGASLKIPNAYQNSKNAYANALQLNPYNPGIYLNLARLEVGQNNLAGSQQYIGKALQLKQNYTEAAFLLSQVQVAAGQIKDAIVSTQFTIQLNPNEPLLYFQLGILDYNDKNYTDATGALEKAVSLNTQYANARYFLGLSYVRVGRNADAITQFEELTKTNPDNKEVAFILSNLKEGKSPFTDAKPPIDSKPEKRKTLPVKEKTTPAPTPAQ